MPDDVTSDHVTIRTGRPAFDELYPRVKWFLEQDTLDVLIDGTEIRGYRSPDARSIWIRDMCDMMRGARYFERDMTSAVEHFADTQAANGRIFDYFTIFPEKLPSERENWTKYVRVPVEADVEFRFVKAAFLAWQATADDAWIRRILPHLERALDYARTHPWRWSEALGLVKRAYTIDTWDFAYDPHHDWLQFRIDDHTTWGVMHGDNSGYYEAFRLLAVLHDHLDQPDRAEVWNRRADELRLRLNAVCWNGRFYTHFVKLTPMTIDGVDEAEQLSLSNPMNINRGAADHDQAVAILREYQRRREQGHTFAEWFSIDPPFPDGIFGDDKLVAGVYSNGGIMPLVGGELARAAFEHGFETYGVDILTRYHAMIAENDTTYLWYHPDGRPASVEASTSPEAEPTDGWGSSAMLYALVEGLAGVEDRRAAFRHTRLSPRWLAAGIDEAEVKVGYAASGAAIAYTFRHAADRVTIEVETEASDTDFHVLLPAGTAAAAVEVDGNAVDHRNLAVESSAYVDFQTAIRGRAQVRIALA